MIIGICALIIGAFFLGSVVDFALVNPLARVVSDARTSIYFVIIGAFIGGLVTMYGFNKITMDKRLLMHIDIHSKGMLQKLRLEKQALVKRCSILNEENENLKKAHRASISLSMTALVDIEKSNKKVKTIVDKEIES